MNTTDESPVQSVNLYNEYMAVHKQDPLMAAFMLVNVMVAEPTVRFTANVEALQALIREALLARNAKR